MKKEKWIFLIFFVILIVIVIYSYYITSIKKKTVLNTKMPSAGLGIIPEISENLTTTSTSIENLTTTSTSIENLTENLTTTSTSIENLTENLTTTSTIPLEKSIINCNIDSDCPNQMKCEGSIFYYKNGSCGDDKKCYYVDWIKGDCTQSKQNCNTECANDQDCEGYAPGTVCNTDTCACVLPS